MVGAGVLSLPSAMSELGWGPGVAVLVISWVVTLYTLRQMVQMHEMVPGKRFDRYHELGQHVFGKNLGLYIVVLPQLVVEVGLNIVHMVIGGKCLMKFHYLICNDDCKDIKLTYFIMIFASVHLVLSHLPNFNSIARVSLVATVMSLRETIVKMQLFYHRVDNFSEKGMQPDVQYEYKANSTADTVFNFFSALGDVSFAYAGHNVVLDIQATIPSTPRSLQKGPMWKGVIIAYIVVALCYFPVALIGYWMYGNAVSNNILIILNNPTRLITMANLFAEANLCCETFPTRILSYRGSETQRMGTQDTDDLKSNVELKSLSGDASFVDNRTKEQKAIDDWLPITSSRKAKWWYAAFHNVTAMVGAGVLSLPYAMSHLGWGPGVTILILSWVITLYTLWQMVEMHEMIPGKRFDRYHELGQEAFGEKLGLYIVVPQQLICEVGVNVVYMVTEGRL
ncbi:hypothetical protein OSB04_000290 [Centaurea solstitialis]|uniref:Amino acid transporter transmembrane domain-containing protein n=1 Tax=Centaurea solstitialis TaxID=347529 RepID=A0AA38TQJ6_9ASTR|nr:hypothetical protein OSB04_000290 [Centaurea solstitialis]